MLERCLCVAVLVSACAYTRVAALACSDGFVDQKLNVCRPYMKCDEIDSLEILDTTIPSYMKNLHLVHRGDSRRMLYASLRNASLTEDFRHGMRMLKALQGTRGITQLYGLCFSRMQIVTEYHEFGSADNLDSLIARHGLSTKEEQLIRLKLTIDYLSIITSLHNSPAGVRVMCDSNDLDKTLSQYVITRQWRLLLVDLDALPLVDRANDRLVKCGRRQLFGSFVAPEQLWPWPDRSFSDAAMPPYDEKTDVWKIPDAVMHFLGSSAAGSALLLHNYEMLKWCKSHRPADRPTAEEVLRAFAVKVSDLMKDLEQAVALKGEL